MAMMNTRNELIKDLWYELVFATKARITRCNACGRTIVAVNERRKKMYCDAACNKWMQRNPGSNYEHVRKREPAKPDNYMWALYDRIIAMGIKL